jgi:hypothetical protein
MHVTRHRLAPVGMGSALSFLVLLGCSSGDEGAKNGQPTVAKDAAPPAETQAREPGPAPRGAGTRALRGTYEARLKSDPSDRIVGGTWTLEIFGSKANFRPAARKTNGGSARGDPVDAGSPVTIRGNYLDLRPAKMCTRRVAGRYRYGLSSDRTRLKFTAVKDRCDIRSKLLSSRPWKRVSDKPAGA